MLIHLIKVDKDIPTKTDILYKSISVLLF